MNHKSRIYIVVGAFAVITAVMFFYVFGKLHGRNQNLSITVASERQTLEQLQEQQRSYEQGKKDVASLKAKPVQPEDLFSSDTHLVKEIKTLEDLSHSYALEMTLEVSGTAKNAEKVKTSPNILSIPYTITVTGSFDKVLSFLDKSERLAFISPVKKIAVSAQKGASVRTTVSGDFYIKKQ